MAIPAIALVAAAGILGAGSTTSNTVTGTNTNVTEVNPQFNISIGGSVDSLPTSGGNRLDTQTDARASATGPQGSPLGGIGLPPIGGLGVAGEAGANLSAYAPTGQIFGFSYQTLGVAIVGGFLVYKMWRASAA